MAWGTSGRVGPLPAPLLFVAGGASMYVGAAVAIGLFDDLSPAGAGALRIMTAAVFLLVWRRPGRAARRGRRLARATAFGAATAVMNIAFYEAVARLPLGTAVALEFCGPVAVAAVSSRRPRDVAAVVLAAVGVLGIADVRWSASPAGLAWALVAAAMWAAYIVLGKRVAAGGNGIDDMAVGFAVASVPLVGVLGLGPGGFAVVASWRVLLLGAVVGLVSSVVPYVIDQVVLRRLGRARFAVLLALLPVTATAIGLLVLGQVPGVLEAAGIAAVVAAVALRSRDGDAVASGPGTAGSGVTESDDASRDDR